MKQKLAISIIALLSAFALCQPDVGLFPIGIITVQEEDGSVTEENAIVDESIKMVDIDDMISDQSLHFIGSSTTYGDSGNFVVAITNEASENIQLRFCDIDGQQIGTYTDNDIVSEFISICHLNAEDKIMIIYNDSADTGKVYAQVVGENGTKIGEHNLIFDISMQVGDVSYASYTQCITSGNKLYVSAITYDNLPVRRNLESAYGARFITIDITDSDPANYGYAEDKNGVSLMTTGFEEQFEMAWADFGSGKVVWGALDDTGDIDGNITMKVIENGEVTQTNTLNIVGLEGYTETLDFAVLPGTDKLTMVFTDDENLQLHQYTIDINDLENTLCGGIIETNDFQGEDLKNSHFWPSTAAWSEEQGYVCWDIDLETNDFAQLVCMEYNPSTCVSSFAPFLVSANTSKGYPYVQITTNEEDDNVALAIAKLNLNEDSYNEMEIFMITLEKKLPNCSLHHEDEIENDLYHLCAKCVNDETHTLTDGICVPIKEVNVNENNGDGKKDEDDKKDEEKKKDDENAADTGTDADDSASANVKIYSSIVLSVLVALLI